MKRILWLFLIATCAQACLIDELEKAITKSDLPVVEKILGETISVSHDEKVALINLATEIIRKRENHVLLNSVIPINGTQTYYKKYLDKNKKLNASGRNAFLYYLVAILSLAIIPVGLATDNDLCIYALAICGLNVVASFYNLIKYFYLQKRLVREHDASCKIRYNDAIQIRQLLYKIKPAAIK